LAGLGRKAGGVNFYVILARWKLFNTELSHLAVFTVLFKEYCLAETVTVAATMRAPVVSDTVPTSAPSGLWAWA